MLVGLSWLSKPNVEERGRLFDFFPRHFIFILTMMDDSQTRCDAVSDLQDTLPVRAVGGIPVGCSDAVNPVPADFLPPTSAVQSACL